MTPKSRTFKTVDYEAALKMTITMEDALPPDHMARFVVEVIAELDLSSCYEHYGTRGGPAYAPEIQ